MEIIESTLTHRPNGWNPTGDCLDTTITHHPRRHRLTARARFSPVSSKRHEIKCSVVLKTEPGQVPVTDNLGWPSGISPADVEQIDSVRCNCEDFYWVWSRATRDARLLNGSIPVSDPKSGILDQPRPNWSRPIRNPGHNPGICKHLVHLIRQMEQRGIVQRANGSLPAIPESLYERLRREATEQAQQPIRKKFGFRKVRESEY